MFSIRSASRIIRLIRLRLTALGAVFLLTMILRYLEGLTKRIGWVWEGSFLVVKLDGEFGALFQTASF